MSTGYFIKLTGTFVHPDGSACGDGTLVITPTRPWLADGSAVIMDYQPVEIPVVAGVVTHPAAYDILVWAPVTAVFTLLDEAGAVVDTWAGLLEHAGATPGATYTDDLCPTLDGLRGVGSQAAYLQDLIGTFGRCWRYSSGNPWAIPNSVLTLELVSPSYDAAHTSIVVRPSSSGLAITTVGSQCSVPAGAKLWVPGVYRVTLTDATDPGTVYLDLPLVSIGNITAAPDSALTAGDDGSGNVDVGDHSWRYAFIYLDSTGAMGMSALSPKSSVEVSSGSQFALSFINTGPAGTIARLILRTVAGDTGDYLVAGIIPDNTTTDYEDNVADASLGPPVPLTGAVNLSVILPQVMA